MSEVIVRYSDNGYGNVSGEIVGDIVRCKECKKAHLTYDGDCKYCEEWKDDDGNYIEVYHDGDHFCSYGERLE